MTKKKYFVIGMGGTFDHFHAGHEKFIRFAWELGEKLIIGVTVPELTLNKPFSKTIEEYEHRSRAVSAFCRKNHIRAEVVALNNVFGPTLENSPVKALAVTHETEKGADLINQVRQQLSLRPLPVYTCEYFLAENGKPLHAVDIRAGLANRQGQIYSQIFTQDLLLSEEQRAFFKEPFGPIIKKPRVRGTIVCVVGDKSLETFITTGWKHDLGIFDLRRERERFSSKILEGLDAVSVKNPAGIISRDLVNTLQNSLEKHTPYVKVEGEEDLAAVALFLLLPLGSVVYYGQPGQGIVEVVITEELKEKAASVFR